MSADVAIILPTYNRLRFLRPAVESVFAQSLRSWELIIADDGSQGETREYLSFVSATPRVSVIWLPHSGSPNVTRNAALARVSAPYVAFIDSDDLWEPDKLAVQLERMRSSKGFRWSYSRVARIDANGERMHVDATRSWIPYEGSIFDKLLTFEAAIATPSVMVERSLLEQVGGFDTQQVMYGDYDLWLRLSLRAEVLAVERPLALVRSHDEHYTSGGTRKAAARDRLLRKMRILVDDPRRLRAIDRERSKNAIAFARAHAAEGRIRETVQILLQSAPYSWTGNRWWLGAMRAMASSILPPPWRECARRIVRREYRARTIERS